jgi:2-oxoglutarate ferredoxin oxidoreductase subunit alpha
MMVAMNPQTWDKDVAEIEPGGYLFYDSTKPLPPSKFREDINVIGMPLTEITNRTYTDPRQRQLFKNIIYLGALSPLLDIDVEAVEKLIGEQFKGKEKLLSANVKALHLGRDWAQPTWHARSGCGARADKPSATASSSRATARRRWARSMAAPRSAPGIRSRRRRRSPRPSRRYCKKLRVDPRPAKRYAIVQAEDELASIGMVIGAAWNGARAFTATSGPGISLMQEFIGLAYFAEIPAVIFDVQRGGPPPACRRARSSRTCSPAAYASHGDTKHVMLLPEDPSECFEFGAAAFDLADRLQTPIFVMLDLDIGMNHRLCAPLQWDETACSTAAR